MARIKKYTDISVVSDTNLRGLFSFDNKGEQKLICMVALSPVSIENARLNMSEEVSS